MGNKAEELEGTVSWLEEELHELRARAETAEAERDELRERVKELESVIQGWSTAQRFQSVAARLAKEGSR